MKESETIDINTRQEPGERRRSNNQLMIRLWKAFMIISNTKRNEEIARVAATMAVENMHLSTNFVKELLKISRGEKTSEELRQEVIKKYAR